jgi:Tol biopolymer transport system component
VTALSSVNRDSNPVVSPDGLTIAFASDRTPSKGWDIWISTRSTRASSWSSPVRVAELDDGADDIPCTISDDRLLLIFQRGINSDTDLFVSRRTSADGDWNTPVPLAELNTAAFDSHGAMTSDGLTIVFDSDRSGGSGLRDLYLASRPDRDAPFSAIEPLSELNTATNDGAGRLADDLRYIIFARAPVGATDIFASPSKLYEATR